MCTVVLSYTTPKRHRQIVEEPFELDGERFTARKPKDSILIYLTAAASENASDADRMYAVMQFINGCLTPAAQARIQARLRDYDDDLELDDLVDLMNDLAEKFGGKKSTGGSLSGRGGPGAGKVITPDGEPADDISPAVPYNRTDRRAAARPAKKAAPAKKAVAAKKAAGRALPR